MADIIDFRIKNGLAVSTTATILGTTPSTSTFTGALIVSGGAGIGQNLYVGGGALVEGKFTASSNVSFLSTNASTTTVTANALYVEGGAGIKGSLLVQGNVVFASDVLFVGTTTNVFSTNTYYTDNIINMHVPEGGIAGTWTTNDNKDIGLVFHNFYQGADNDSFLGWASDTGYLEWYSKGLESVQGVFTGTEYGFIKAGGLILTANTASTSPTTGALIVSGGVGIGENLNVSGDLAINGADLTSTATTFNLLNSTVTTLNFAGAGTNITIGAATGATTIRNLTTISNITNSTSTQSGSLQVRGGVGIGQNLYVGGGTNITGITTVTNTTNATSTSSGALQVFGGGGIGGNLYVGGDINVSGSIVGTVQGASDQIKTTRQPAGATYYLTFVDSDNASATAETLYTSATIHYSPTYGLTVTNTTNATSTVTGAFRVAGGVGIGQNLYVGGGTSIIGLATVTNTTNATSTTTGALEVKGGVGIGQNLYVGGGTSIIGLATVTNTTNATSTTTGALEVKGGVGIGQNLYVGGGTSIIGLATVTNTTNSTSTNSGAFQVLGGVGIGQNLYVGGITSIAGLTTVTNTTNSTSTQSGALTVAGGVGIGQNLYVGGGTSITGLTTVTNTTNSTSTNSGAFQVLGGVGIGGNLYVGGNIVGNIAGTVSTASQVTTTRQPSSGEYYITFVDSDNSSASAETVYTSSTIKFNPGIGLTITNTTAASSTLTGALRILGGVGIGGSVWAERLRQTSPIVAIGNLAGVTNQGNFTIAVGQLAGNTDQGEGAIAIGSYAGQNTQTNQAIAIGAGSGRYSQGSTAIAIGVDAGNLNQGLLGIAIGNGAGANTQTQYAIAIGELAGYTKQGEYAVAIGSKAGQTNQPANSIIINAGSTALNGNNSGLYISPIRGDATASGTNVVVNYNPVTKELTTSSITPFAGIFTITNTTNATSTTTGALQVAGGVGIGQNLFVGGITSIAGLTTVTNTTNSTSTQSGALTVAGGVGIGQNLYVGGNVVGAGGSGGVLYGLDKITATNILITGTTNSTNTTSGVLQVVGGGGIGGNLYIGGNLNVTGSITGSVTGAADQIKTVRQPTGAIYYLTFVDSDNSSATAESFYTSSTLYFSPTYGLTITNTTVSTSTITGALTVAGGVGIGQNLYVGGGTRITGITTVSNTTNSTNTSSGALQVAGGLGIGGNFYAGGDISAAGATLDAIRVGVTANNEIDTSAGNLILDSANGTVQVDDNLIVTGNLTVQGATTIVDSTVTNVSDPIFLIGTTASGAAHVVDDSKDRGIAFAWHNGTNARTGFFGFDRSTQYFTFFTSATIANEIVSGAGGTSKGAVDANLAGGSAMAIVYQSAADTTAFLAAGTAGNILQTNGTGAAPSWVPVGNVSVGTSTNATKIATVRQASNASYYLTFVDSNNASASFEDLYTTSSFVINPSTGAIGIGTTSPLTKLTVSGDVNLSAASNGNSYKLYFGEEVTSGPGKSIFMENYYMKIQGHRNEGIILQGVNASGTVQQFAAFYGDANTNASQIHLAPSGGNVGIGTTAPGYKLEVNGSFAATTKSFVIDHPTKPGYKLRYGSLEGPENGVYVRGRLKGNNKISLPEYWTKLVDEDSITVQLTSIGNHQTLFVENVSINEIKVGGMPKHRIDCYYTVFAERNDVSKLDVEILK